MTGRFETWLAGGKAAAPARPAGPKDDRRAATEQAAARYPGQRYGLPQAGPGAVSGMLRRLAALVTDTVLAGLVTLLFVHPRFHQAASMVTLNYWAVLTWFLITVVGTAFFGFTPGMALLGIRVARLDGATMVMLVRAMLRAALVAIIIPAVVWDQDNRGLQDKATGTIVVRMR